MTKAPLVVATVCLILNCLIGDTIFANVILVMIAFFAAITAFLAALIGLFRADPGHRSMGGLGYSIILIAFIIWLVATDNIAAGYGP